MGSEKEKKKPKSSGGGGYKWGSGFIWAGGQFAVNWFITYQVGLWGIGSACFSAFIAGWTTSAFVGRFAKWGANAWILLVLGVVFGVAIFSGAQLLTLGIMGEYVARIHHRVLREPAYVVRERLGDAVDGNG